MMRRLFYALFIIVLALLPFTFVFGQSVDRKDFEIVRLKAMLWDQLVSAVGEQPLQKMQSQDEAIKAAIHIVNTHGDSVIVEKFKAQGFPVEFKR